jgi:glycerophosphoryl diester phosphodiesterase
MIEEMNRPLIIAHRGASAYYPEHTIAAYTMAIEMGADFIEPDLCSTKDHQLIVRHENNISDTTNVAEVAEFANRKTTKVVDGEAHTGWFTEDFTLAELMTLYAIERIPQIRPLSVKHNNQHRLVVFQQVIDLVKEKSIETGRVIGIYPEVKHPSYFRNLNLPLEDKLLDALRVNGYDAKDSPCVVQSFEISNLKELRKKTRVKIVQLINTADNPPYDTVLAGNILTCEHMFKPEGLKEIAAYADFIGPFKDAVIPRDKKNRLLKPTTLVQDAHNAGLKVHIWTLRPENHFLPSDLKNDPAEQGYIYGKAKEEIMAFLDAGIDGFFTDAADTGRDAVLSHINKKS